MASKRTPEDVAVAAIATRFADLNRELENVACPKCGSFLLSVDARAYGGLKIVCGGQHAEGDDDGNCTFMLVRRHGGAAKPQTEKKPNLVVLHGTTQIDG